MKKSFKSINNNAYLFLTKKEYRSEKALHTYSSRSLFICGLLMTPIFLLTKSLEYKTIQFIMFIILNWLLGKRINMIAVIIGSISIMFFNLFVPFGRILVQISNFRLTEGALLIGIEKSVTFEGLIFLSRASIRSDLYIPGNLGKVISESFYYFEAMMSQRFRFDIKKPIESIDQFLEYLDTISKPHTSEFKSNQNRLGYSIEILILLIFMGIFIKSNI